MQHIIQLIDILLYDITKQCKKLVNISKKSTKKDIFRCLVKSIVHPMKMRCMTVADIF